MDRYWFLTWRTYGTWLPGEDGFVGYYLTSDGGRVIDNIPGEPTTNAIPELECHVRASMKGEPVLLVRAQADALLAQFQETARYRGWVLDAVAVMINHVHLVYGVLGDPDPSEMLKTWKSYASRALNRLGPKPNAPRWFVDSGSKRRLRSPESRIDRIRYVRDQTAPLLVWLSEEALQLINPSAGVPGEPAT